MSENKYKPGPIRDYLEYREHLDHDAAATAAKGLAWVWNDHYFFRAWAIEVLAPCVDASPEVTDTVEAVLDRLTRHIGVRVSNGYLPNCHGCHNPLRLADIAVPTPTGRCRTCTQRTQPTNRPNPTTAHRDCAGPARRTAVQTSLLHL